MSETVVEARASRSRRRSRKSPSCSCTTSSAITGRATPRCRCSTGWSLRCGRGSRWRWWRPPAPASRRCCTSPACWSIPTAARSISTAARPRSCPTTSAPASAATRSASSTSRTICCRNSPRWRTCMLPQMIRGLSRREATKRATELLSLSGPARAAHAPAGGTVGRRAAARGDRARGRQCAAHPARRRADRQSRRPHRRPRVRGVRAAHPRFRPRHHHRHPQYGTRRPHGPAGDDKGRADCGDGIGGCPAAEWRKCLSILL